MIFERSKDEPCLFYYWVVSGLVLIVSWVDDMLSVGSEKALEDFSDMLQDSVDSKDVGDLKECLDCNLDREGYSLYATQPVLVK